MSHVQVQHYAGIDVSAATFDVVLDELKAVSFSNTRVGHEACAAMLTKRQGNVRVVVEATSVYHLDLCVVLAKTPRIDVMVANPRQTYAFMQAQGRRAKTDVVDSLGLRDFARTMPFESWKPPAPEVLEMRALTRYVDQLTRDQTAIRNQLHASKATTSAPRFVIESLAKRIKDLDEQLAAAATELAALAQRHAYIAAHVRNLMTMPGVGELTATRLVAEYLVLDPAMTSKQLAAWAGLDPRPHESGTSVRGRRQISKRGNARVRHALYMPALSAIRRKNAFATYYERIADRSAAKMIAVVATMRKMLTVSWALFRTNASYEAERVQRRVATP